MGKNGKAIRAKYDKGVNDRDYRPNSLRNYNPHPKMEAHLQNMQAERTVHLLNKTHKGALRLTTAPLNKRGKRIRPDVVRILSKHTAKAVQSAIGGLPKEQAKNARRLKNQRYFKKLLKTLDIPIVRGSVIKKVRRPDKYIFAIESTGGRGGRTRQ